MNTAIEVIASAHRAFGVIPCPVPVTSDATASGTPGRCARELLGARVKGGVGHRSGSLGGEGAARQSHGHESPGAGLGLMASVPAVSGANSRPPMSMRKGGYLSVIRAA